MSTTSLFVELIVIGVGALVWLVLLVGAVFGYSWVSTDKLFSAAAALPGLAFIYVLGIVSDRIADALFERIWTDDLRGSHFRNKAEYYKARRLILTQSEQLSELLEYGRSRLRICRGWTLNSVLILVSLNVLLFTQYRDMPHVWSVSIFGSALCLALALGSWFAWQKLVKTEYRKIKEQAGFLEGRQAGSKSG